MAKTITEKELTLLFPSTDVEIAGHTFEMKPFSFVESKIVSLKLRNVLHLFAADTFDQAAFATMYTDAYDGIRDVIALSLGIKPNLVDRFDLASAFKAITNIISINKDFFLKSVNPELKVMVDMFADAMEPKSPATKDVVEPEQSESN